MLVAVTGVSGSGKSSLVHDVLYPTRSREEKMRARRNRWQCRKLRGEDFPRRDRAVWCIAHWADAALEPRPPIPRHLTAFADLYASIPDAKKKGFNGSGISRSTSRVDAVTRVREDGTVTVEMQFLADVELVCEECHGTRYKPKCWR